MYITQLLDPLKSHFENNFPSYFALPDKETKFSGSAKKFLSDKLFKSLDDEDSTDFYGKIGTHGLSPLTVTMMMMGCYGDIQSNVQLRANVTGDTAVLFNVLLQTLEYNFGSKNDKSACSCLKDFANPQLATAKKQIMVANGEIKEMKDSDSHHLHYDSCQSQNLQDFVYNGNYDKIDIELVENVQDKPYVSMSTDYIARTKTTRPLSQEKREQLLGQRNREDPMLYELSKLHNKILTQNAHRQAYLTSIKQAEADASFLQAKTAWKLLVQTELNKTSVDQVLDVEWQDKMQSDTGFTTVELWKASFVQNLSWSVPEENEKLETRLQLQHIANEFPDVLPMFTHILHNVWQDNRQIIFDLLPELRFLTEPHITHITDLIKENDLHITDLITENDLKTMTIQETFDWLERYIKK
jgi:hypothetical protein